MKICTRHRLLSRSGRLAAPTRVAAVACALCVLAPASAFAAPARQQAHPPRHARGDSTRAASAGPRRRRSARSTSSAYPAGATRPAWVAKPSEYAHSASTGAAVAPVPGSSSSSSSSSSKGSSKGGSKAKPKPKPKLHGDPARALAAFEAMQSAYYIRGSGLYKGEPFSFLWPFSQALAATVTLAHVQGVSTIPGLTQTLTRELNARLIGLNAYLDRNNSGAPEGTFTSNLAAFDGTVAPPTGPGGTKYYDDNEWVGIELVRMYELTHYAAALGSAEAIMAFVMAGWDSNPELVCPGGVPFSNSSENTDRNTVTNGPGAELALQLYRITGRPSICSSRKWRTTGCAPVCCSRAGCTRITSANTERWNRCSGATTRAR